MMPLERRICLLCIFVITLEVALASQDTPSLSLKLGRDLRAWRAPTDALSSRKNLSLRGGGFDEFYNHTHADYELNNPAAQDFDFDEVFRANREWSKHIRDTDPLFFENLAKAQHPKILWIGCSDARVPANVIMGADPGTVFVQRNIANQVLSVDANVQAVIQVPHIVVCGHYGCGGVLAATKNHNHGSPLENWLRNIRDVHRIHHKELEKVPDGEARMRRLVELNVVEQCLNLYKTAVVQRRRFETKRDTGKAFPIIHGLVYDLAHGELLPVQTDVGMEFSKMQEMYELYDFHPDDRENAIRVTSVERK